jgi:hypothetical protein
MNKQKLSASMAALLAILACFLLSAGLLAYYVTSYRPNEFHAQATTVARDFITAQARATYQGNLNASMSATATSRLNQSLYLKTVSSQPILNDPLNQANDSYWEQGSAPNAQCSFTRGAYHAQISSVEQFYPCMLQSNALSDFALQVNMTLIKGEAGGIIFHLTNNVSSYNAYLFTVTLGGSYSLLLLHEGQLKALTQGYSQAINNLLNAPNQLMVISRGNTFLLFVNGQLVDNVSDSTLPSGGIGVFAFAGLDPTDAAFNDALVWKL